jgi:hypothetical protein
MHFDDSVYRVRVRKVLRDSPGLGRSRVELACGGAKLRVRAAIGAMLAGGEIEARPLRGKPGSGLWLRG